MLAVAEATETVLSTQVFQFGRRFAWTAQRLAVGTAGYITDRLCRLKSSAGQRGSFK